MAEQPLEQPVINVDVHRPRGAAPLVFERGRARTGSASARGESHGMTASAAREAGAGLPRAGGVRRAARPVSAHGPARTSAFAWTPTC